MHPYQKEEVVPIRDRLSWSPKEASAVSGLGQTTLREAINDGSLIAYKHGRLTKILPDDLIAYLKARPKAGKKGGSSPPPKQPTAKTIPKQTPA